MNEDNDDAMSVTSVLSDNPMEIVDVKELHESDVILTGQSGTRYKVLPKPLGQGSFGTVYKGVNVTSGEFVAVKFYNTDGETDCAKEHYFLSLNIPGVCRVFEPPIVLDEGKKYYLIMEYIDGKTFSHILRAIEDQTWQGEQALVMSRHIQKLVLDFVSIIVNLEKRGFEHRDLNAFNIMVRNKDFSVVILDFGLACIVGSERYVCYDGDPDIEWVKKMLTRIYGPTYFSFSRISTIPKLLEMVRGIEIKTPFKIFKLYRTIVGSTGAVYYISNHDVFRSSKYKIAYMNMSKKVIVKIGCDKSEYETLRLLNDQRLGGVGQLLEPLLQTEYGPCMVLEFVPNLTLYDVSQRLIKESNTEEEKVTKSNYVRTVFSILADIIADMHDQQVVYGDLNKTTVLVDDKGMVTLVNFENSCVIRKSNYCPFLELQKIPEMKYKTLPVDYDFRSADVYTLGKLICGVIFGADESKQILKGEKAPLSKLDEPLAALLDSIMFYPWNERPTARDISTQLSTIQCEKPFPIFY